MTVNELRRSRARWRSRELYRRVQWRRYVRAEEKAQTSMAKASAHEMRKKWSDLYEQARSLRLRRDRQIKARDTEVLTDKALNFLAREEGVIPYAYNDPVGHATFGVGHLIHEGPVTSADRLKWGTPSNPKPRSFVMNIFDQDLDKFEKSVKEAVKPRLKRHQFAALVSLAFNIGVGGFRGSTVARRLNGGDLKGAADAILMWDKPEILRARRERERRLFLTGKYS